MDKLTRDNGTYTYSIDLNTGTKVRELKQGEQQFIATEPEAIDIKITNYCDAGCSYCHEHSTTEGKHADFDDLIGILHGLRPLTELAIGGGNPLDYPSLDEFLYISTRKGMINNMTVNQIHLRQDRYKEQLLEYVDKGWIHGIGLSIIPARFEEISELKNLFGDNLVLHTIAGVHTFRQVERIVNERLFNEKKKDYKILVLGYKVHGRGERYFSTLKKRIQVLIRGWEVNLPQLFKNTEVISFDNLALEQLNVKHWVRNDEWNKRYMGDEGQYTMYIDAVNKNFGVASTSKTRFDLENKPITEIFEKVHMEAKNYYEREFSNSTKFLRS